MSEWRQTHTAKERMQHLLSHVILMGVMTIQSRVANFVLTNVGSVIIARRVTTHSFIHLHPAGPLPCGTTIEAFGSLLVNSVCSKTCFACEIEDASDLSFPYTVTNAPFSPATSHYSDFTVEEESTVHIETLVPLETEWFAYSFFDTSDMMGGLSN